jgi:hypothetical protein
MRTVLEIFKMAGYFPDSPCTSFVISDTIFERTHCTVFYIPVSVTEIYASKEIGVLAVITTKNSYTWNMTHNTKVFHSETRSLSSGDHCWFMMSTRNNRPVTRDYIKIIIINLNHSDNT